MTKSNNIYPHSVFGLKELETLYLDYFNNYLTVDRFANDNGFTANEAIKVIDEGRKINQGVGMMLTTSKYA